MISLFAVRYSLFSSVQYINSTPLLWLIVILSHKFGKYLEKPNHLLFYHFFIIRIMNQQVLSKVGLGPRAGFLVSQLGCLSPSEYLKTVLLEKFQGYANYSIVWKRFLNPSNIKSVKNYYFVVNISSMLHNIYFKAI